MNHAKGASYSCGPGAPHGECASGPASPYEVTICGWPLNAVPDIWRGNGTPGFGMP
jgi:hypothetical protein